jgi:hypothetical protein
MCLFIYIYRREVNSTAITLLALNYSWMIIFLLGLIVPSRQQLPSGSFKKYLLVLEWLPGCSTALLRTYRWAELTAASVVVPQVMAYVSIACIPFLKAQNIREGSCPRRQYDVVLPHHREPAADHLCQCPRPCQQSRPLLPTH